MSSQQQLLNFADKQLMTSINTSSMTVDGYEIENLLRKKRSFHQQNSFMCEYYMKCPVDIVLTFPCLVDISYISIEPKVSSHRSKHIEIYTLYQAPLTPDRSKVKTELSNSSQTDDSLYPCKFPKDFSDAKVMQIYQSLFNFAGKYNEPPGLEETPDQLVFTNPLYSQPHNIRTGGLVASLNSAPSTRCCSHMLIKIKWATVAVLRSLQVWGTLSSRNPKFIVKEFEKLLKNNHMNKVNSNRSLSSTKRSSSKSVTHPKNTSEINIQAANREKSEIPESKIPDEFIDSISCSIMTVPMMLPSGKTIDKVTLEKYSNEEEKHGRLPSDPFTGIVFHGSKMPIPNSSLKARIDDFLLKNPSHISKDGATTGYRNNHSINKTVDNLKEVMPASKTSEKRKSVLLCDTSSKKKCLPNTAAGNGHHNEMRPNTAAGNGHHNEMRSSLDLALGKVLSNLPTLKAKGKIEKPKCRKCGDGEFKNLLKLPCCHICCRKCIKLILFDTKKCIICHKAFERINVTKLTAT